MISLTPEGDDEAFVATLDLVEEYLNVRKLMDDGFRDAFLELALLNRSESGRLAVAALSAQPKKKSAEQQGDGVIQSLASKYGCAEEETAGGPVKVQLGFSRDLQSCAASFAKTLEFARQVAGVVIRLQTYMNKVQ